MFRPSRHLFAPLAMPSRSIRRALSASAQHLCALHVALRSLINAFSMLSIGRHAPCRGTYRFFVTGEDGVEKMVGEYTDAGSFGELGKYTRGIIGANCLRSNFHILAESINAQR